MVKCALEHDLAGEAQMSRPGKPIGAPAAALGASLKADGKVLDSHSMPRSLPIGIGWVETFNVGVDTGTPLDDQDTRRRSGSPARSTSW